MTQRNGRIIRQGNMNKEVKVFNYVTEGTFDSYLFQTLENKQRFISQIMTSKSPVRSCEDVDEQALSYAEIKALCAGNPLIKEKMDLDVQVAKLKVLKADHQSQKFRLQDKLLTKFPADIQETNAHIAGLKADAQLAAAHPQVQEGFCGMTIKGVTYDEKKRPPVSVWSSLVPNCPTPKKKSSAATGALNCPCGSIPSAVSIRHF